MMYGELEQGTMQIRIDVEVSPERYSYDKRLTKQFRVEWPVEISPEVLAPVVNSLLAQAYQAYLEKYAQPESEADE